MDMDVGARGALRVELLGAVRAWRGDCELNAGPPRQRAVLAVLAMRANEVVSRSELLDAVWGEDVPGTAVSALYSYVAGLRRVLDTQRPRGAPSEVLTSTGPGYMLRLAPGHVDVEVFEHHLCEARRSRTARELRDAAASFEAALSLWHGAPWAGIPGPWAEAERARLTEQYATAAEEHAEIMVALGRHAAIAAPLSRLTREYPFRERLAGLLMLVLYRSGRQAEALAAYQRTRRLLREELGVEPSASLQRLHHDILVNRDSTNGKQGVGELVARPASPVPSRQLPTAVRGFSGRAAELKVLNFLLQDADDPEGTLVVATIDGAAGVGKTALAVHWAHRVTAQFPDGQLYVNLRGFDPSATPMTPAAALRFFLDSLAVPADQIPPSLEAQAALYRSLLADKRVLVILDNANHEDQVRPLLPGARSCMVIVTSRNRLTGLIAAEGAHPLTIDRFTTAEARQLLAHRLGPDRVVAEPGAADELIRACTRLPLALSIAAARTNLHAERPLADLVTKLRDSRLDALDAGDATTSVRAVFSSSYNSLDPPAARIFRLLGVHPGPDATLHAVASLAGLGADQARVSFGELTRLHLLCEHPPGRFVLHDLLRDYAAERAQAEDDPDELHAALQRMLDHYLHTAHSAARLLHPGREGLRLAEPKPGVRPEALTDHQLAMAWYQAEHRVLLATVALAADKGFDAYAWQLPWTMVTFLYRRGYWDQWTAIEEIALAAARRLGDLEGQARAHLDLGYIGAVTGGYNNARGHLNRADRLFRQLGDLAGQARAHNALAIMLEGQGRLTDALSHAEESLALYLKADSQAARANALTEVSWLRALLGDHRHALGDARRALRLHRQLGNRHGESSAWDTIGYAWHQLGRHHDAVTAYQRALSLQRYLGDRQHQANTLSRLGDTYHAAGDEAAARDAWQEALAILKDLHHPDADQVRAKLMPVQMPALNGRGR